MSMMKRLQERWKVKSAVQVVLILVTFAATGSTVVYISKPLLNWIFSGDIPLWGRVSYYILILPVYNLFLLFYGFIFGQFQFFWAFEKRFLARFSRRPDKPRN